MPAFLQKRDETQYMYMDHAERLAKVGLTLQPSKSKCYINPLCRGDDWHRARGAALSDDGTWIGGTTEGSTTHVDDDGNSQTAYGVKVCNVPVGTDELVDFYLRQKSSDIAEKFQRVKELLEPIRFPQPDLCIRQMLHCLNSKCLQFLGDYWLMINSAGLGAVSICFSSFLSFSSSDYSPDSLISISDMLS